MSNLRDISANPSKFRINPLALKKGWELKKLSQKHKTIIALHSQGLNRIDIGSVAGCTPEYVSMIVRQPLAQAYLKELDSYNDDLLRQTHGKAVQAIHDCLDSDSEEVKLKAARLSLEANGKMKTEREVERTAEDVVASILARAGTLIVANNVQVNQEK